MKYLVDGQTLATPEVNRGIGVYFINTLTRMIENDLSAEWYINVMDTDLLYRLKPWVRRRLRPLIRPEFNPAHLYTSDYGQVQNTYNQALEEIINTEGIDIYWHPNPLMLNVCLPLNLHSVRRIVTVHDLIPLVLEDNYLKHWKPTFVKEYKDRISRLPHWSDVIIFDSESTRSDFETLVAQAPPQSRVIHLGVEHSRFAPLSLHYLSSLPPYVLFTGGFDYRKNMENALRAFSQLVHHVKNPWVPKDICFVVVCGYTQDVKEQYEKLADSMDVGDRLILTGYISDNELEQLYKHASVFFFPSLYEGFGLPVLEAMACGVPVVVSNSSSLTEISGDCVFSCDPMDIQDMANTLSASFQDTHDRKLRIKEGIRHVQKFTWTNTALLTLDVFRDDSRTTKRLTKSKPKIAYVSLLSPQRSGIAKYSEALLPYLKQYSNIDLFVDGYKPSNEKISSEFNCYDLGEFVNRYNEYDATVYHIGNSIYHKKIYEMAWAFPGIVVLHDYNIHSFMQAVFLKSENDELYRLALIEGYGKKGEEHYQSIRIGKTMPSIFDFPMSHALIKRSKSTIVHHLWVKHQFGLNASVKVIPHGVILGCDCSEHSIDRLRTKYKIPANCYIIACYGFINFNKRPEKILHAALKLREKGFPIHVLFGGELSSGADYMFDEIDRLGMENFVTITGFLQDEEYEQALHLADIVVNLRFPSMGEASGTLVQAFSHGKATLVSNIQQYTEYPDTICWKVDVEDHEVDLIVRYIETLLKEPDIRFALGQNALRFCNNVLSFPKISKEYMRAIEESIRT